jgi:hypothetical protein
MPHIILKGEMDLRRVVNELPRQAHRWGTAVLKIEEVWARQDFCAVLVEGVVVEHSRAVHPVAIVATGRGTTSVRLWPRAPVERTPAVQRWLAVIAAGLSELGGGAVDTTNVAVEILAELSLNA